MPGRMIFTERCLILMNERYDVITLWHVLEHIKDPVGAMKRAVDMLDDGGS